MFFQYNKSGSLSCPEKVGAGWVNVMRQCVLLGVANHREERLVATAIVIWGWAGKG